MGYAQKKGRGSRVKFGDEYWADVRPLNAVGKQEAQRILYGDIEAKEGPQIISVGKLDTAKASLSILTRGIVDWNVDGPDGMVLPITEETVDILNTADQEAALVAILASDPEFLSVFRLSVTATAMAEPPTAPLAPEVFPEGSQPSSPETMPSEADSTPVHA